MDYALRRWPLCPDLAAARKLAVSWCKVVFYHFWLVNKVLPNVEVILEVFLHHPCSQINDTETWYLYYKLLRYNRAVFMYLNPTVLAWSTITTMAASRLQLPTSGLQPVLWAQQWVPEFTVHKTIPHHIIKRKTSHVLNPLKYLTVLTPN